MSYLVLARKWRPQVFEDVVGQRPITQTLQNAISQKRVAHAFLFSGARGVGKTSTARILAKALNCESGPGINPCNHCKGCQEISSGTSMDVIEIDGASNRGIDEIRELRENVRYTPAKSRYKIYIIDEVHMLTREAFNALLKTLEEPPPHIIFIFATTEPHKIPATILSRCQRYDFKRIPLNEIVQTLNRIVGEEQLRISEGSLLTIARESEGSMRDAQSLLDQVISYGGKEIKDEEVIEVLGLVDRKILFDTLEAIAGQDAGRCMEIVEQIYHFGYDLQHFCRELLQYLRHLMLLKVSRNPGPLVALPKEELELLKKEAEKFQFDQLNYLFSLLLKGEEEVAQSTFPRTMLEMTLIRMATLKPIQPIEEILKKLERLEETGPSPAGTKTGRFDKLTTGRFDKLTTGRDDKPVRQTGSTGSRQAHDKLTTGQFDRLTTGRKAVPEKAEEAEPQEKSMTDASRPLAQSIPEDEEEESGNQIQTTEKQIDQEDSPKAEKIETASLTADEGAWRALVDFTRAKNPIIGSFLALGELIQLSEDRVEIGFEKDSFHYERMLERENRSLFEQICQDYLQKKAKVVISPLDPGLKKQISNHQEKPSDKGNGRHPLVQEALRLFNGKIVEG